jgi:hypothetical protein
MLRPRVKLWGEHGLDSATKEQGDNETNQIMSTTQPNNASQSTKQAQRLRFSAFAALAYYTRRCPQVLSTPLPPSTARRFTPGVLLFCYSRN